MALVRSTCSWLLCLANVCRVSFPARLAVALRRALQKTRRRRFHRAGTSRLRSSSSPGNDSLDLPQRMVSMGGTSPLLPPGGGAMHSAWEQQLLLAQLRALMQHAAHMAAELRGACDDVEGMAYIVEVSGSSCGQHGTCLVLWPAPRPHVAAAWLHHRRWRLA